MRGRGGGERAMNFKGGKGGGGMGGEGVERGQWVFGGVGEGGDGC